MKTLRYDTTITPSEAVLLQQLQEMGEEDARSLSYMLGFSRQYTASLIERLRHKGLVAMTTDIDGIWIHLTNRGKQLLQHMWPEARSAAA